MRRGVLFRVARDFLVIGSSEPIALAPGGSRAIVLAAEHARRRGDLAGEVDEVLRLCVLLEQRSPGAAEAIVRALDTVPAMRESLGVHQRGSIKTLLRRRALRRLDAPVGKDQIELRSLLDPTAPDRMRARRR